MRTSSNGFRKALPSRGNIVEQPMKCFSNPVDMNTPVSTDNTRLWGEVKGAYDIGHSSPPRGHPWLGQEEKQRFFITVVRWVANRNIAKTGALQHRLGVLDMRSGLGATNQFSNLRNIVKVDI